MALYEFIEKNKNVIGKEIVKELTEILDSIPLHGAKIWLAKALVAMEAIESIPILLKYQKVPEINEVLSRLKKVNGYKEKMLEIARNYERAFKWEEAANIYEELEMWEKAGEMRKLAISPKSVQLQYIETIDMSTNIKDSVVHKRTYLTCKHDENGYAIGIIGEYKTRSCRNI